MDASEFEADFLAIERLKRRENAPLEDLDRLDEVTGMTDAALLGLWVAPGRDAGSLLVHGTGICTASLKRDD